MCEHLFACNCVDCVTHSIPCKHIHAVFVSMEGGQPIESELERDGELLSHVAENEIVQESQLANVDVKKLNIFRKIETAKTLLATVDSPDALNVISRHLQALITVAKGE